MRLTSQDVSRIRKALHLNARSIAQLVLSREAFKRLLVDVCGYTKRQANALMNAMPLQQLGRTYLGPSSRMAH